MTPILRSIILTILTIAAIITADASGSKDTRHTVTAASGSEKAYLDSLRNDNQLLAPAQAYMLVHWLGKLKETASPEEMRQYCAEALAEYTWYLVQHHQWYLIQDISDMASSYCASDDNSLYHSIQSAKAGVCIERKQYRQAEKLLLSANSFFKEHRDTTEWLKTCINLARLYQEADNKSKSFAYYKEALDIAARDSRYTIYYAITLPYMEKLEIDSGLKLEMLQKALQLSVENNFTLLYSSCHLALARYYMRAGDEDRALANATKASEYASKYNQTNELTQAFALISKIYSLQKDYVMAFTSSRTENSIVEKSRASLKQTIFDNINNAGILMRWCQANVPLDNRMPAAETVSKENRNPASVIAIILLALATAGLAVYAIVLRRKRNLVHMSAETDTRDTDTPLADNTEDTDTEKRTSEETHAESSISERDAKIEELRSEIERKDALLSDNRRQLAQLEKTISETESLIGENKEKIERLSRDTAVKGILLEGSADLLTRVRNMVKEIPKTGNPDVDNRLRSIASYLLQNRYPERDGDSEGEISQRESDFLARLDKAGKLTGADKRLALYLRLGLTPLEICIVNGIQPKSLNQARYRLRKTLGISQDESLEAFLKAL